MWYNLYMTYLFFGSDSERISMYLNSFLNKFFNGEEKEIVKYNAQDTNINEIFNDLCQLSLSFSKRAIVVDNATFLEKKNKYSKTKESKTIKKNDYSKIIKYIDNDEDENTLLIFVTYSSNIDLENSIVKNIDKNNRKLLEALKDSDWPIYIKKYFEKKGKEIEEEAINEIIIRSNNSLKNFTNEAQKLLLFSNKKITLKDVKEVFINNKDISALDLSKALIKKDKKEALEIYKDLRSTQSIEPVQLITLLTSSLIFLDQVSYLKSLNYSNEEVAIKLGVSSGRIYYSTKDLYTISRESIKKALTELYNLDRAIKHNEIDRFYSFEMFLLNF